MANASNKTLTVMAQVTPPPKIDTNRQLLSNISALAALNPKELMALAIYFRCKELANDSSSPLSNYDPVTFSKVLNLVQDSKTFLGNVPVGDLVKAGVAIDWNNCYSVYAAIGTDVETIRGLTNMSYLVALSEDEMRRILLYLRLEIGE